MEKSNLNVELHEATKPILNTLRRYSPLSILEACLDDLYSPARNKIKQLQKKPWIQLLLVKWVYTGWGSETKGRPKVPTEIFRKMVGRVCELQDKSRKPTEYQNISLFFRTITNQQFPFQLNPNFDGLARQWAIFAEVKDNHFFKTCFLQSHKFPIDTFLQLSFFLQAYFIYYNNTYVISEKWFYPALKTIPKDHLDYFLNSISVDHKNLPSVLREEEGVKRQFSEYYQMTPFIKFPLIKVNDKYWCINPQILQICLEHYLFDFFKKTDANRFNEAFGAKQFERYVGALIGGGNLLYADENELNKVLKGNGKVVDFIVADGESNVFIEAKGVEMAPRGKIAHLQQVVEGATKTSLIKALEQGQEVCSRISSVDCSHQIIRARCNNYLIVVTYKELYICNGLSLCAAVGEDSVYKILDKYNQGKYIPLENIYFLSVNEFEKLMSLVNSGQIGLVEALERAKRVDSVESDRKFTFIMHIKDWISDGSMQVKQSDVFTSLLEKWMASLS